MRARSSTIVAAVSPKRSRPLARRGAVALLGYVATATAPDPLLVGACAALEPRVIHRLPAHLAGAAAQGLVQFGWPVRPALAQIERLMKSPLAKADLALAAAIAGLLPNKRLPAMVKVFGLERTLDALLEDGGDAAWRIVCALPREKPPLDLILLQQLEARSPARYVVLASIAIGAHTGDRLEDLIKAIPRKYREEAFASALLVQDDANEQRLTAVGASLIGRLDRAGVVALLARVIERPAMVRVLVRVTGDKQIAGAIALLPARWSRVSSRSSIPASRRRATASSRSATR